MLHSTSDEPARFATADRGYPHARMDGGLRGAGTQERLDERDELGRNGAPAGGLAVSAVTDMARWLLIQLDAGLLPGHSGQRLFSEAAHRQMWTPVVLQPIPEYPPPLKVIEPNFNTYALGWDVTDYAGTKVVWHGGAVFGFLTAVVLIPDKHVGFAIEINSEDGEIIRGLMYELLDHYLGASAYPLSTGWGATGRRSSGGSPRRSPRSRRRLPGPRLSGRLCPSGAMPELTRILGTATSRSQQRVAS